MECTQVCFQLPLEVTPLVMLLLDDVPAPVVVVSGRTFKVLARPGVAAYVYLYTPSK